MSSQLRSRTHGLLSRSNHEQHRIKVTSFPNENERYHCDCCWAQSVQSKPECFLFFFKSNWKTFNRWRHRDELTTVKLDRLDRCCLLPIASNTGMLVCKNGIVFFDGLFYGNQCAKWSHRHVHNAALFSRGIYKRAGTAYTKNNGVIVDDFWINYYRYNLERDFQPRFPNWISVRPFLVKSPPTTPFVRMMKVGVALVAAAHVASVAAYEKPHYKVYNAVVQFGSAVRNCEAARSSTVSTSYVEYEYEIVRVFDI